MSMLRHLFLGRGARALALPSALIAMSLSAPASHAEVDLYMFNVCIADHGNDDESLDYCYRFAGGEAWNDDKDVIVIGQDREVGVILNDRLEKKLRMEEHLREVRERFEERPECPTQCNSGTSPELCLAESVTRCPGPNKRLENELRLLCLRELHPGKLDGRHLEIDGVFSVELEADLAAELEETREIVRDLKDKRLQSGPSEGFATVRCAWSGNHNKAGRLVFSNLERAEVRFFERQRVTVIRHIYEPTLVKQATILELAH